MSKASKTTTPRDEVSQGEKSELLGAALRMSWEDAKCITKAGAKLLCGDNLSTEFCTSTDRHPRLGRCGALGHNMLCTREANHEGPHIACGKWEHNYLVWAASGQVLGGSQASRVLRQLNGRETPK